MGAKENIQKRNSAIDLLRIIACFMVIVNHTIAWVFWESEPNAKWFLSVTYFFVSKIAVPIFVMISGYTLLNKQDSYRNAFKRIMRIVEVLLLFSFVYYCNECFLNNTEISIKLFLEKVIYQPSTTAFWYLYLYLGILVMMPFLQKMVPSFQKRDFEIFFLISGFIYGVSPILEHYNSKFRYAVDFETPLFSSYICLLFVGYYIRKYVQKNKKWLIGSVVVFILATAFNVFMTFYEYHRLNGENYLFFDNRVYLPILIESVCVFYFVLNIKIKEKWSKIISIIGGCTFGIYLLADMLTGKLIFVYQNLAAKCMYPIVTIVIYEIIIFMAGLILTYIMKKIPILKNLV